MDLTFPRLLSLLDRLLRTSSIDIRPAHTIQSPSLKYLSHTQAHLRRNQCIYWEVLYQIRLYRKRHSSATNKHNCTITIMLDERELAISPIVQDSVQHNARVRSIFSYPIVTSSNTISQTVSNIRALTASLFGVAAGTMGLESLPGFIFYFIGTAIVSVLIFSLKAEQNAKAYFFRPFADLWAGDLFGGLMSFVLTWTLFYGLCKA